MNNIRKAAANMAKKGRHETRGGDPENRGRFSKDPGSGGEGGRSVSYLEKKDNKPASISLKASDNPITISETADEEKLNDQELKKACFEYARKNFQGKKYANTDTGKEILVSRDGLDEWNSKTKSREQSISIKKLDTILVESKKTSEDPTPDRKNRYTVEGFTYFIYEMNINKKPYKVYLTTKETRGTSEGIKSKYYYHFLKEIKIEPGSGLA